MRREGAVVPAIWPLEMANALLMAVRRKRISSGHRDELLTDLRRLNIEVEEQSTDRVWSDVLALADRHALTVYDAAYLELALRRKLALATLDEALRAAATVEGVTVLG